jgi:DNA-directed RNA polymerase subunit K/omega
MASKKVKINQAVKTDKDEIVKKVVEEKKVIEEKKVVEEDYESNKKVKTEFDAYDFYKNYDSSKNVFNNVLSLYEFTSCLGLRATQISEGCPVLIDVPEGIESPEEIAIMEMKAGKCPLIICREGREYWRVCDLINPHLE